MSIRQGRYVEITANGTPADPQAQADLAAAAQAGAIAGDIAGRAAAENYENSAAVEAGAAAGAEAGAAAGTAAATAVVANKADKATTITGDGLATGGGTLGGDRVIAVPKASAAEALSPTLDDKAMTPYSVNLAIKAMLSRYINGAQISIFGDSTGFGVGASTYGLTWGWMFAKDPAVQWAFYNASVGGENTTSMLARVAADIDHRDWPTIFMDLPNTGENSATWLANMRAAAEYLPHNRWVVWPPARNSPSGQPAANDTAIAEIQAALLSDPFWSGHTLDATDQASYLAAVNNDATRVGGGDWVHFNDLGQAIQCLYMSSLFSQLGWRVQMPETTALAARITTPWTDKYRAFANGLIERQTRSGVWAKRDGLIIVGPDMQATRQNWKGAPYSCTDVGGVFLAPNTYFKGNGAGVYFDTGFNPTTAVGAQYTLNSAHMGIMSRTNLQNGAAASTEMGNANSRLSRGTTSGLGQTRPNYFSTRDIGPAAFPGDLMFSRTAASVWEGYSNGVDTGGGTDTASGLTNAIFGICGAPDVLGFGLNELVMAYWGSGLTASEAAQDYTSRSAYARYLGAF